MFDACLNSAQLAKLERTWLWRKEFHAVHVKVDEHGKPLVVYHGTRHEFSRFDIDKGQVGVHFSVSPEVANAFARSRVVRAAVLFQR